MTSCSERVCIGVGSNIEPRLWYVRAAILSLRTVLRHATASSIYETEPELVYDQPRFLNAAVAGDSSLGPFRLLDAVQAIERRFGRRRELESEKGPRTLDLDLLLFGDRRVNTERLVLPHPGLSERDFVLVPVLEILPEAVDPRSGRRLRDVLSRRRKDGVYRAPRKLYTEATP